MRPLRRPRLKVTRGGDDGIFVFLREETPRPLLTVAERESLYLQGGQNVVTGKGSAGEAADAPPASPPELRKLLQQ